MRRALASTAVILAILRVVACTPFDSSSDPSTPPDAASSSSSSGGGPPGQDGGETDGQATVDAVSPDFCTNTIACDLFDVSYGSAWMPVPADLYQPSIDTTSGRLVSALTTNAADPPTSGDACQLQRTLPIDVKMRIEFDLTFFAPNDYRGHNVQILAVFNGTGPSRTYLGLYVQTPGTNEASLVLTLAYATGGPRTVGVGSLPYGVSVHIAIDVALGTGSAVRLDSAGATDGTQTFTTIDDTPPVTLLLGAARQNGGTDALRAEYDNFRVLPIATF